MSYSKSLARAISKYLDSQDWHYDFNAEKGFFKLGMNISCKLKTCQVFITIRDNGFSSIAISPLNADSDTQAEVTEFITRLNYSLLDGAFKTDYSDGEVRYVNSLYCGDSVPSMDVIERTVDLPFMMLRTYGDELASVIMGFSTGKAAAAKALAD